MPGGTFDGGLQLRQLSDILKSNCLAVEVRVVDDQELAANRARAGDFVIVNDTRGALGQKGGGHLSPLGASDEASRSFLVLDTNPTDGKVGPRPNAFPSSRREILGRGGACAAREDRCGTTGHALCIVVADVAAKTGTKHRGNNSIPLFTKLPIIDALTIRCAPAS